MKNRKFWEIWADTEEANARLGIALYGMIALVAVLVVSMARMAAAPKPVYYIPGAESAGKAYPNYMPEECIAGFAENFVQTLANFTPANVERVYRLSERYLSPALLSQIRTEIDSQVDNIRRDSLSSHYSIDTASAVEPFGSNAYVVNVSGQKRIYLGKTVVKDNRTLYTLHIRKVRPTEANPYGLQIQSVSQAIEGK